MFSILLNLLRFVLWYKFHGHLKRMCILLFESMPIRACWVIVLLSSSVSLLISFSSINCWKRALKSNYNCGFPHISFLFCQIFSHILLFCCLVHSHLWLLCLLILDILLLCNVSAYFFALISTSSNINITTPTF